MRTARALTVCLCLGLLALAACREQPDRKPLTPVQKKVQVEAKQNTGLPMRLTLPEGGHSDTDFDLLPPRMEVNSFNWNAPFHYTGGFENLVADWDAQLKRQKFSRLSGPIHDVDPGFLHGDTIKPLNAQGKKAWISADKRIVAFLSYQFQRAEKGSTEVNNYQLNVIKFNEPQEVKPPNEIVAIP